MKSGTNIILCEIERLLDEREVSGKGRVLCGDLVMDVDPEDFNINELMGELKDKGVSGEIRVVTNPKNLAGLTLLIEVRG